MRSFFRPLSFIAALAWLFCPVAAMAYQCEEIDLISTPGWIWKAVGDARHDFGETYIFTFKESGLLLTQQSLPGGKVDEDTASYRIDGKMLKITFHSGWLKDKEMEVRCNLFNGQLQLTFFDGEETYVFDPQKD